MGIAPPGAGRSVASAIPRLADPGTTGVGAPAYHRAMGLGALPLAVARINYRLLRIPLRLLDDPGLPLLGETGVRQLYTQLLIECDRTAAHLLGDDTLRRRPAHPRPPTPPPTGRGHRLHAPPRPVHPTPRRHHPHRPSPA